MATDYKGIKINNEVIIVAKDGWHWNNNKYEKCGNPQGYVVDVGNKNMLETARNWAHYTTYKRDENGNYLLDEKGNNISEDHCGAEYTYANGKFKFQLLDSADGSSQGGKLSFWNCLITAPDGKEFEIGINAEILLNLLKHNTFEKGVCASNVWLGRIKGSQVGAFTENMPEFEQAKADQALREAKNTKKYSPGAILKNKSYTFLYLGEVTEYFSAQDEYIEIEGASYNFRRNIGVKANNMYLVLDEKPFKYHLYLNLDSAFTDVSKIDPKVILDLANNFEPFKSDYHFPYYCERETTKQSRIVVGQVDLSDLNIYDFMRASKLYNANYDYYYYNKRVEDHERDRLRAYYLNLSDEQKADKEKYYKEDELSKLKDHYLNLLFKDINEIHKDLAKLVNPTKEDIINKLNYWVNIISRYFEEIDQISAKANNNIITKKVIGILDQADYMKKFKKWNEIYAFSSWSGSSNLRLNSNRNWEA